MPPSQAITEEKVKEIVERVLSARLPEAIAQFVKQNEERARELSLMERILRVEEELKSLREIESSRFEVMENRFENLQREMDKRFEVMENRFENLQREMDKRFEAMDKRFEAWSSGLRGLRGGSASPSGSSPWDSPASWS